MEMFHKNNIQSGRRSSTGHIRKETPRTCIQGFLGANKTYAPSSTDNTPQNTPTQTVTEHNEAGPTSLFKQGRRNSAGDTSFKETPRALIQGFMGANQTFTAPSTGKRHSPRNAEKATPQTGAETRKRKYDQTFVHESGILSQPTPTYNLTPRAMIQNFLSNAPAEATFHYNETLNQSSMSLNSVSSGSVRSVKRTPILSPAVEIERYQGQRSMLVDVLKSSHNQKKRKNPTVSDFAAGVTQLSQQSSHVDQVSQRMNVSQHVSQLQEMEMSEQTESSTDNESKGLNMANQKKRKKPTVSDFAAGVSQLSQQSSQADQVSQRMKVSQHVSHLQEMEMSEQTESSTDNESKDLKMANQEKRKKPTVSDFAAGVSQLSQQSSQGDQVSQHVSQLQEMEMSEQAESSTDNESKHPNMASNQDEEAHVEDNVVGDPDSQSNLFDGEHSEIHKPLQSNTHNNTDVINGDTNDDKINSNVDDITDDVIESKNYNAAGENISEDDDTENISNDDAGTDGNAENGNDGQDSEDVVNESTEEENVVEKGNEENEDTEKQYSSENTEDNTDKHPQPSQSTYTRSQFLHSVDGFSPLQTPHFTQKRKRTTNTLSQDKNHNESYVQPTSQKGKAGPNTKGKSSKTKTDKVVPSLPKSNVHGLFKHFSTLPVSKQALEQVERVSEVYWNNVVDDLSAYAAHAGRPNTIREEDVELLLRRQGFVNEKQSLYSLVEEHLPLEYRQEIIPIARSGNILEPKY